MRANQGWVLLAGAVVLGFCGVCVCAGVMAYGMFAIARSTVTSEGEFSGYYTSGFEVSSFVPCGSATVEPGYGQGYWLSAEREVRFYERYSEAISEVNPPPGGYVTVFTRFRGRLSTPGSYGHVGAYVREVTVVELLEISLEGRCE